jgi:hypothetical protein
MIGSQRVLGATESHSRPANISRNINFRSNNLITDVTILYSYRGADKSLARPTSPCILFDGENILFDDSLLIYIYK